MHVFVNKHPKYYYIPHIFVPILLMSGCCKPFPPLGKPAHRVRFKTA